MSDPSTTSSQAKTSEQKADHGPVPSGHGGVVRCLQKGQSYRSFYFPTRGRAQLNTAVVNARIRRIQVNLDSTDTLLHMGPCLADTRVCGANADKLQLMKKEKVDGHGPCPMDTGPCPGFCVGYK
ncbi:hypothetical protein HanLR1_Chr11g0389631 [Helianthus annuus]|nr:hypothetical protein HanHA89_Chr11g0412081 [Helianthus annuus]KAJ0684299.1 hypothetical protein HanLR1_Chr11g0389631 [Helianthus annuus]